MASRQQVAVGLCGVSLLRHATQKASGFPLQSLLHKKIHRLNVLSFLLNSQKTKPKTFSQRIRFHPQNGTVPAKGFRQVSGFRTESVSKRQRGS